MALEQNSVYTGMRVDHVRFFVQDSASAADLWTRGYAFSEFQRIEDGRSRTVGVGRDDIRLLITEPRVPDHQAAIYVSRHGDGIADIGLGVADARTAFHEAVSRGAVPLHGPTEDDGVVTASILAFADVAHTFVQRAASGPLPPAGSPSARDIGAAAIDHFAVCLPGGQLDPTVAFYEEVLDFRVVYEEKIFVGRQSMNSKVVQSTSGAVTFTLIEPDLAKSPGQIDTFLRDHGGAGIQHVALRVPDIVRAVDQVQAAGVEFLSTPGRYYDRLDERIDLERHSVKDLRVRGILADEDHDGQLFQIFAKPVTPRNTFFVELIERLGATTFGSGNIKALYEAVMQSHDAIEGAA
ncbi:MULTISPECIES: 4-hydroxyphenylpyruvate dioxygenase [Amycolatopsis]|uniref:4-hydroxyphenylpyruvate dioxygenase n=1 Tax=Amycolatopsis bullii TaxID=941987 RepID=A0ABQ3K249_9PSEU|nr:4-hydroxyphenylpyruvate dioxygenase [Amycolatopsis bullii]GHF99039.1 4-hydroxyphenylpyruvate dioxygenase [Amycolatopsis bullii]